MNDPASEEDRRGLQAPCDILLVEDNPTDVEFLKRALEKADSKAALRVLGDGQQAMTYLFTVKDPSRAPSLVITDLKMPRMNGHELIQWMRRQPHLAHVPIVVLSSSGMPQDIDRAIELGANAYLEKPLGFAELDRIVQSLLATWLHRGSFR